VISKNVRGDAREGPDNALMVIVKRNGATFVVVQAAQLLMLPGLVQETGKTARRNHDFGRDVLCRALALNDQGWRDKALVAYKALTLETLKKQPT
jgi:hypothetical protein